MAKAIRELDEKLPAIQARNEANRQFRLGGTDPRFRADSAALSAGPPDGDQDIDARRFLGMQPVSGMLEDGATYHRPTRSVDPVIEHNKADPRPSWRVAILFGDLFLLRIQLVHMAQHKFRQTQIALRMAA